MEILVASAVTASSYALTGGLCGYISDHRSAVPFCIIIKYLIIPADTI